MNNNLSFYVSIYKEQLQQGHVQTAYLQLMKYVMALKAYLEKSLDTKYSFGNISPGYMDYSYFPFFNSYLRENKLRFGIVLNHKELRFELWLMGQNAKLQDEYWSLLKNTQWNAERTARPRYSVLEQVLVAEPDFDNLEKLSCEIKEKVLHHSDAILACLKSKR